MKLVLVESPTKARTLSRFLGKDYRIEATYGHIRDLPKERLGVEVSKGFAPEYVLVAGREKKVEELRRLARGIKEIVLATDPDREGEAIAWHVAELLRAKSLTSSKDLALFKRIVFHEITKEAIEEALAHPRGIDMRLVNAQQARRILDRLVGYKLSPLLWKKVRKGLSAGRVQSVALRFIVEREQERKMFKSEEFWQITAVFESQDTKKSEQIDARLVAKNSQSYEIVRKYDLFDGSYTVVKTSIKDSNQASKIVQDLQKPFIVQSVDKKETKRTPPPPFITSSLQQTAANRLGFSAKRTVAVAQRLYEHGLITYHRTDSVSLSEKFIGAARRLIEGKYGSRYLAAEPRQYRTRSKTAQEAHEAIRPTTVSVEDLHGQVRGQKSQITQDMQRLYELIWRRAMACQAAEAIFASTKIKISAQNGYEFKAAGSVIKFDGYLKILGSTPEDLILPAVANGEEVRLVNTQSLQKFTQPPPRYSQASLIKALEKHEVGRPSTYAPIISTILDRQYVELDEKWFLPTQLGVSVSKFLVENFSEIVDIPFTAQMEESLDGIAQEGKEWRGVLEEFYNPFVKKLKDVEQKAERVQIQVEKLDENCPDCQKGELVIRVGKFGKFIACLRFPKCKYSRNYVEKAGLDCPKCSGEVVVKRTRRRKRFYGCSNYPECDFAAWKKSEIEKKSEMEQKQSAENGK